MTSESQFERPEDRAGCIPDHEAAGWPEGWPQTDMNPPEKRDPGAAEQKARAMLWQAVWEASQFCNPDEIRRIVEGTLWEIETDEP